MAISAQFDPELVYVECGECGEPVLWAPGTSTRVLCRSGLTQGEFDASCMILSEGCPHCTPGENRFTTQIVRLMKKETHSDR